MGPSFFDMIQKEKRRLVIPKADEDDHANPPAGYEELMTACWSHVSGDRPLIYMIREDVSKMMEFLALEAAEEARHAKEAKERFEAREAAQENGRRRSRRFSLPSWGGGDRSVASKEGSDHHQRRHSSGVSIGSGVREMELSSLNVSSISNRGRSASVPSSAVSPTHVNATESFVENVSGGEDDGAFGCDSKETMEIVVNEEAENATVSSEICADDDDGDSRNVTTEESEIVSDTRSTRSSRRRRRGGKTNDDTSWMKMTTSTSALHSSQAKRHSFATNQRSRTDSLEHWETRTAGGRREDGKKESDRVVGGEETPVVKNSTSVGTKRRLSRKESVDPEFELDL
jgi:hypothetical protein